LQVLEDFYDVNVSRSAAQAGVPAATIGHTGQLLISIFMAPFSHSSIFNTASWQRKLQRYIPTFSAGKFLSLTI
jgi:hypothetical protein